MMYRIRKRYYHFPTFVAGVGSVLDVGGPVKLQRIVSEKDDLFADLVGDGEQISEDYRTVGQDYYKALENLGETQSN